MRANALSIGVLPSLASDETRSLARSGWVDYKRGALPGDAAPHHGAGHTTSADQRAVPRRVALFGSNSQVLKYRKRPTSKAVTQ